MLYIVLKAKLNFIQLSLLVKQLFSDHLITLSTLKVLQYNAKLRMSLSNCQKFIIINQCVIVKKNYFLHILHNYEVDNISHYLAMYLTYKFVPAQYLLQC